MERFAPTDTKDVRCQKCPNVVVVPAGHDDEIPVWCEPCRSEFAARMRQTFKRY